MPAPAILALATALIAALPLRVVVSDPVGGRIAGAEIVVQQADAVSRARTDASGVAIVEVVGGAAVSVSVRADGFADARRSIPAAGLSAPLHVVLEPARVETRVTVTATRAGAPGATPAPSSSVLQASDLASSPGITLDDALRQTPWFGLFRRSTSRVANPTTQGVTLRGLSASGASRTLVLADGVPLNDPFGGWVSWNRVPLAALQRVEVVRGGAGDLYGADALGGVVQLFTEHPQRPFVRAYLDAAGQRTGRGSFAAGFARPRVQALLAAEAGTSRGYVLVAPESRGSIDEPSGGTHGSALLDVNVAARGWQASAGGTVFTERRRNGTPFQRNDTAARSATASLARAAGGYWRAAASGGSQGYDQSFSAVRPDRTSETPTATQRVPADVFGASTDWARGAKTRVLVGAEYRSVRATNQELRYVAGAPSATTSTGGRQRFASLFGQVAFDLGPSVNVLGGARVERWTVQPDGPEPVPPATLVSPRASVSWRVADGVTLRGSVGRAHRSPTLNERYRGFRVGDTQTLPNAALEAERLTSAEAGAAWTRGGATLRSTLFVGRLDDAITNVTVATTPVLTTRLRRNLGSIDVQGLEVEAASPLLDRLHGEVAATVSRSRFGDDAPAALAGNRTPQVPSAQVSGELRWDDLPRVAASLRALVIGGQYEDDLNTLLLRRATVVDAMISRAPAPGWLIFAAVENALDADYDVGRTPLRTVGSPRLFRTGVRLTWP